MNTETHSTASQNTWVSLFENCGWQVRRSSATRRLAANVRKLPNEGSLSPVPRPLTPPRGITLTEVLISLGILTIGLLGVAALFPVGSFYMQKGEIADNGSAIAQAAFNDLMAQGMLNPNAWYEMAVNVPFPNLTGVDNGTNTFSRPVAAGMASAMAWEQSDPNKSTAVRQSNLAKRIGSAFVIDPMGIAGATSRIGGPIQHKDISPYPATAFRLPASYYNASQWGTWSQNNATPDMWPVRRVTFLQSNPYDLMNEGPTIRMEPRTAEALFSSTDDLVFDLPTQGDRPAVQTWEVDRNVPIERRWRGDYSWLATVVPTTTAAWNALATNATGHAYEVSVVVFHKRAIPRTEPIDDLIAPRDELTASERSVRVRVISTGLNGGEVLLERMNDATYYPESPFEQLKTGNWIMLCGPHPKSTYEEPLFVLRWYRVLSIDGKETKLDANGQPTTSANEPERRLVMLRGPQWPWQPTANLTDQNHLSNNLCAGIVSGAVAVHSKTVRMSGNSIWSGGIGGNNGVAPGPVFQPH